MAKREEKIFVKPGEGRAPRHLFSGRRISVSGEWVPNTPAFRRLLTSGDLERTTPPKKAGKAPPRKKGPAPEETPAPINSDGAPGSERESDLGPEEKSKPGKE